ncbi:transmembrane protein 209 [Chironomus tepperi]|uniref:transmembrane protein 209 n=1 Tax=Chironomus tepperi TaxID=113505 RepID=UPI00391FC74B
MHKTHLINKTLDLHLAEIKRKSSLKWSSFNFLILSVLVFDVYKTDKSDKFYWIEVTACLIILISLLKNIITYLYYTWFNEEIACENEEQRILLSLNKSNSFVKAPTQSKLSKQESNDMFAGNIRNLSWQSYGEPSTANLSQHTSWMSNTSIGSYDSTLTHHSDASYSFQSPSRFNKSDFIMDRKRMEEYLNDVNDQEKRIASAAEAQNNLAASSFNSFWGSFDVNGFVSSLKNLTYQLSPHNKQSMRDESFSNKDEEHAEIIRQMSANKLSNYVANLKMYIHKTILEPLVHAIDDTDKAFEQRGFTDMKIGHVGIERLKKIASSNQQLIQFVPTLPKLLPFLELTTNQEFLVQRIRELAKGSCLKNYKFTSSSYDPSNQNDHKPNDAGILFHLFCCYLDSQLQPVPDISRPFYNRYVIIGDSKKTNVDHYVKEATRNKSKCAILCSNPITPKFNFVTDKIHGSSHDRNNLFYVIIQFLFHLKSDGMMLETVSLGKSGLNLINVIED